MCMSRVGTYIPADPRCNTHERQRTEHHFSALSAMFISTTRAVKGRSGITTLLKHEQWKGYEFRPSFCFSQISHAVIIICSNIKLSVPDQNCIAHLSVKEISKSAINFWSNRQRYKVKNIAAPPPPNSRGWRRTVPSLHCPVCRC